MKVAKAEQHVLGSQGLTETGTFKIKTNATAFKILSSGLYSDKIAAVLREIGCNAADAHTEYGSPDKPIIVKLPNRIDNQFYIRDEGRGLSHNEVMNLYTTYFDSTKRDSNAYTGAFGLGSKSPFSYVDTFSITSVHDGVKRSYSAYLDNGSPTVSKLSESPADADWPHGVEIGFPVKYEDFPTFEDRAQNIYRWFKTLPQIEGARAISPALPFLDFSTFSLYKGIGHLHGVVMGNVFYPLDLGKMDAKYNTYSASGNSLASHLSMFNGVVLKLDIGDVQVAASREELQYDPDSQAFLKKRAEAILGFIGNDIATKLRAAKTWVEKCVVRGWSETWGHADLTGLFKALKYPDAAALGALAKHQHVPAPSIMGTDSYARVISSGSFHRGKLNNAEHVVQGKSFDKRATWRNGRDVNITLNKNTKVYYGDKNLSSIRANEAMGGGASQILLFTSDVANKKTRAQAQAEAEAVARELGIPLVEDLNTIPLPASYVPSPKKIKLKKGAAFPPLPSLPVTGYSFTASPLSYDISTLSPDKQNFMVRARTGGWGRSRDKIRVYNTTAELDHMYDQDDWRSLWGNVSLIAKKLSAPFTGYVELSAIDVKKLDLPKRGWKTTDAVVKEWLSDPAVADDILKEAKNWRPTMQLNYRENMWAQFFVWLAHSEQDMFKAVKPVLKKVDMHKAVEHIRDQSVKQGQSAGQGEPAILASYRYLASVYKLPAITITKDGSYLSVEDFNNDIDKKYPLTSTMDPNTFHAMYKVSPTKALTILETLFS